MAEAPRDEVIERVIAVAKLRRQREQERVARALQVPPEEYRELPPVQKPVSDDELPLKPNYDSTYERYRGIFESASTMQLEIPVTPVAEPLQGTPAIPWIVEAPLNSVEVLEAILKPSHPFQIHAAHHVQRRFDRAHGSKRLYSEYIRLQGQLERNREVSFIRVPASAEKILRHWLMGFFKPVLLNYISIPWTTGRIQCLAHPRALVMSDRPVAGIYTYEILLATKFRELGLSTSPVDLQRSLLKRGTTPLPETIWDWFAGRPGTTAALPYFTSARKIDLDRKNADAYLQREGYHKSEPHIFAQCCLPTTAIKEVLERNDRIREKAYREIEAEARGAKTRGTNKGI
ncbi:hypothetical protein MGU_09060 [Metarhizium guizhouense ARSEF 977]|uniref:Uncharacterized protein n=1 Tax=Metarhizium guizhouense (strain ARSEF 977) TaxID=1276136 RepID=A0A0B4HVW7_METGA|nr:hypothetical protein MGU_09060 [Metarhizium guizhouense ARSEF 977]